MKKIISLFKRDYEGTRQAYDEIVPGAEWVAAGEGVATVKYDGTCCMVRDGKLFKRYDRKLSKIAHRCKKRNKDFVPSIGDYKVAPEGWEAAEPEPNFHTGHWPGWVPIGDGPGDKWHHESFKYFFDPPDGTYELVGPKVQGNPYNLSEHVLVKHTELVVYVFPEEPPRDFLGLKKFLGEYEIEGIVWHHPDRRMVKIKRKDFGFPWPVED